MTGPDGHPSISPAEALDGVTAGRVLLIDIRERHERLTGMAAGAEALVGDALSERIENPGDVEAVALICDRGVRSARVREAGAGRCPVALLDVAGGMQAWTRSDLPVDLPASEFSISERTRYLRHFALAGVGEAGQARLKRSSVIIVGAGGLGSPCALYLAAAGVGRLDVVDDDRVELSNLQRQVIHAQDRVGEPKASSAQSRLAGLNADIEVRAVGARIDRDNVETLLSPHDVVIDGSDNFPTRYLLNDACIRLGKTLVYGAIERFTGQVGVFRAGDGREACYRCLFPEPPDPADAPDCAEAGVFGVLPGVVGSLQAVEVLKLLLGMGRPLVGSLLRYDALEAGFDRVRIPRDPACRWCDPSSPIEAYPDYASFCSGS